MCSPTRASLLTGLESHRAGFGTVAHLDPGFPGYAMELGPDVGDDRRDPARPGGLRHDDGGEVAPGEGLGLLRRGPAALVALPARVRPLLRDPRRVHEPAPAAPHRRGQPSRRGRPVPGRLLLHRRPHRSRDLDDPRAQGEQPGAAVLPATSRTARCTRRCTPGRTTSPSTAAATTVAGTSCGTSASPASGSSASCPTGWSSRPATPSANHDVRPWDDLDDREQRAVRPPHGGLRGDGRPHRPERRPAGRRARRAR